MTTIYVAGPMRGYDDFNFPALLAAGEKLREAYKSTVWHEVEILSPAEHDLENGFDPKRDIEDQDFDLKEAMAWDLHAVLRSDWIFVLPGWRHSRGARAEVAVAHSVGIPVYSLTPEPQWGRGDSNRIYAEDEDYAEEEADAAEAAGAFIETVTDEAHRIVYGDRADQYGPPTEDFARTAQMWTAVLGMPVTAKQVALCMVLLKVSREIHKPKRDNIVDLIGYALCAWRVETNS